MKAEIECGVPDERSYGRSMFGGSMFGRSLSERGLSNPSL